MNKKQKAAVIALLSILFLTAGAHILFLNETLIPPAAIKNIINAVPIEVSISIIVIICLTIMFYGLPKLVGVIRNKFSKSLLGGPQKSDLEHTNIQSLEQLQKLLEGKDSLEQNKIINEAPADIIDQYLESLLGGPQKNVPAYLIDLTTTLYEFDDNKQTTTEDDKPSNQSISGNNNYR